MIAKFRIQNEWDFPIGVIPGKSTKRSLYISRPVLNADQIRAWARAQGFTSTLPPNDMHVTVTFSRTPVDWSAVPAVGKKLSNTGGARSVEKLGEDAVVLFLTSDLITKRWKQLIDDYGASWDFEGYHPHITLTYKAGDMDLSKVVPYKGTIIFGPEKMEEVNEGWKEDIVEVPVY